jgi:hypothetical protein
MPTPATNVSLYSLNSLTGIELEKRLILSQRPLVSGVAVALTTDISGGGGGGGTFISPNGIVYALSVDDSGALITTLVP